MVHNRVYSFLQAARERGAHLASSAYSLAEIEAAVAEGEKLARRENELMAHAGKLLEGQNYIMGFESDAHRKLDTLCAQGGFWLENSKTHTREVFPVAKWQKVNASHSRWLDKVEKALLALSDLQTA